MARGIRWALTNFRAGLHTEPSKTGSGEIYAIDMDGLRVDPDGRLINRYPLVNVSGLGAIVSGLSISRRGGEIVISYLLANGVLKLFIAGGTDPNPITDTDLTGKLSSDFAVKNVVILTSNGVDTGYWLDLQSFNPPTTPTVAGYKLGIVPPDASGVAGAPAVGGSMAVGFYYYRFTYLRSSTDLSADDPFQDAESNPATTILEVEVTAGNDQVDLSSLMVSSDPQVTRKNIYRSTVQASALSANAQADLTYYRITNLLNATTTYSDTAADASITGNTQLRTDNDKLPTTVSNLAVYNDLIFAACSDELRYSDIRNGSPIWWAFPLANTIRVNSEIEFCVRYRDVLLFGGPNGIWRLTGSSEFNFDIDQISEIGPVDAFAWTLTNTFMAFVGVNGLYFCDGIRVEDIHNPLIGFFRNIQIKTGSVIYFHSEEILFTIYADLAAGGTIVYNFLRQPDGTWQKWEDANILQGGNIITTSIIDGEKSIDIYIVEDGENEIREILWDRTGITTDSTNEASGISIPWLWKSQILTWSSEGEKKFFQYLDIDVAASATITVQIWIDRISIVNVAYNVTAHIIRPYRVRIGKRGESIQIQLSGTAAATIERLQLIGS